MLQYLGFIEARTNQIVGLYSSQIANPQSGEQEPSNSSWGGGVLSAFTFEQKPHEAQI